MERALQLDSGTWSKTATAVALLGVAALWPLDSTQLIEVSYRAQVIESSGVHADELPAGTPFNLIYRLNSDTPDHDADPRQGFFPGALVYMQFAFPKRGIRAAVSGGGNVQTYNDVQTSDNHDQVYLYGAGITSATTLGGEPIETIEADFLSRPGPDTTLITSDALPVTKLRTDDASAAIGTPRGFTKFRFAIVGTEGSGSAGSTQSTALGGTEQAEMSAVNAVPQAR